MRLFLLAFMALLFSAAVQADDEMFPNNYAVVWSVAEGEDNAKLVAENLAEQANAVLDLWKAGRIENVYMTNDQSDSRVPNSESGFVFFIKAKNEEQAAEALSELPFVKKGLATYVLHKVGVLWLKQYKDEGSESDDGKKAEKSE